MEMKKNLLILLSVLCVVLSASVSWGSYSIGKDFFDLAENYKNFAEFEKALNYCEKSITIFNSQPEKSKEIYGALSAAYYLKANLLNYMQGKDKKIEEELFNALIADPDFVPPENYTNNPKIVKLLKRTQKSYADYIIKVFYKIFLYL